MRSDRARVRTAAQLLELLEPRRLLAAFTINGTAASNSITVIMTGTSVTWETDGSFFGPQNNVTDLTINGLDGADTVNLQNVSSSIPTRVNGGNGNDTVVVGTGDFDSQIAGAVSVNGDAGSDVLRIDDTDDFTGLFHYLRVGTYNKSTGTGSLGYQTVEKIQLDGSNARNVTYNVLSCSSAVNQGITVNGGGDTDIFNIGDTDLLARVSAPVILNGGGALDFCNVGAGDLDGIAAAVTFNGGSSDDSIDSLVINDGSEPGNVGYTISGFTIARTGVPTITFSECEVDIQAGSGANVFLADGAAPSHLLTMRGGPGSDTFSIAAPASDIAILGEANGTGVGDEIFLTGTATATGAYSPDTPASGRDQFNFNGHALDVTGIEQATVQTFAAFSVTTPHANDNLSISANSLTHNLLTGSSNADAITPLLFGHTGVFSLDLAQNDTPGSNDSLTVSSSGVVTGLIGAELFRLDAGVGNNTATVNGARFALDTKVGVASGTNLDVVLNGGAVVTFSDDQTLRGLQINAGSEANFNGTAVVLDVQNLSVATGTGRLRLASPQTANVLSTFDIQAAATLELPGAGLLGIGSLATQSHGPNSTLKVLAGLLNMHSDAGTAAARRLTITSSGDMAFFSNQHLAALNVAGGITTLSGAGNRVIVTSQVSVTTPTAALDLVDNDLILDYAGPSQIDAVRALITSGYNGGLWNGPGIRSSSARMAGNTALGYADAAELFSFFPAPFAGQSVDNTSVLIKYTFYGDADLSGSVNLPDFNRLAASYGQANRRWINGDSDYNGIVNLPDFNRLASNYGRSGLGPLSARQDGDDPLAELM